MKIKDVKEVVLCSLKPFAEDNGFKIRKGAFDLVSKKKNPKSAIDFTYNSWGFEVHLFPWVSVDFNIISDICKCCGYELYRSAFINLFVLENIKKNGWDPDMRWQMQVANTDRIVITDWTENWTDYCVERIMPLLPIAMDFINSLQDISSIDRLYNSIPIERYNPYCIGMHSHCIIGIIAAKLTHNANYGMIKDMYVSIARNSDFREDIKEAFFKIVDYLDTL